MRVFVTGGTGFVGSHFVQQALSAGIEVVALRRPGSKPRIPLTMEPQWVDGPLDGDYLKLLQGIDTFIHLASHTPNPPYAPLDECLYWNVFAAIRLARQARASGVSRFIIAGSCFEYGRSAERVEQVSVDTPLEPALSYPISKAAASIAFEGFARETDAQLVILRIFQVFGQGEQDSRLWPSLRRAALAGEDFPMTSGDQVRDFVAVEEVASQFIEALSLQGVRVGHPVVRHVASGEACTLREFAQTWWRNWGATGQLRLGARPYRSGELMRLVPDIDSLARPPKP